MELELYVDAVVDLNISTEQCYNRIVCRGDGRPKHIKKLTSCLIH